MFKLTDCSPAMLTELAAMAAERAAAASAAALEYGDRNRSAGTERARIFWSGEVERAQDMAADYLALSVAARAELPETDPTCCQCDAAPTFRITVPTDASGPAGTLYCDRCAGSTSADLERVTDAR